MKVFKQPMFYICIISLVCAAVVAFVSTSLNPKLGVLKRLEKGIEKMDSEMVASCFYETEETLMYESIADFLISWLGIEDMSNIDIEILVADREYEPATTEYQTPAVLTVKMGDAILYVKNQEFQTMEITGKEYLVQ